MEAKFTPSGESAVVLGNVEEGHPISGFLAHTSGLVDEITRPRQTDVENVPRQNRKVEYPLNCGMESESAGAALIWKKTTSDLWGKKGTMVFTQDGFALTQENAVIVDIAEVRRTGCYTITKYMVSGGGFT